MTQAIPARDRKPAVREKFATRTIYLVGEPQRETLTSLARQLPIDPQHPLEIVVREKIKTRGLDANARMWVGPLKDIAEQGYVGGRSYSAEVWHEHFKKEFLPEEFDAELTKEGYAKWDYTPGGDRILIGSTTQLTVKGFAQYMTQVEAFGANLGVEFSASPNEGRF
jgi:hypothetical protein